MATLEAICSSFGITLSHFFADGNICVLMEITMIRLERGWSEYELAKNSGISQSIISTWYRKNQTPTIQALDKVCKGFGITLSQFFAEGDDSIFLTQEQKETLDNWSALNQKQRQLVTELLKNMSVLSSAL